MVLGHNIDDEQKTLDVKITQDVTFESMLLSPKTLKGLKHSGFYKPSPIQLHGIPLGKCGFDLTLEAKSGTGKTAVFTIISLEKIDLFKGLQVIMLAPTREIAAQICDVIKQVGSFYEGLNVEVVMGGFPVQDDILKLKKRVHIIVGSPGRLRHLIQDKFIDTSTVRLLVLDEADKLLEKSFLIDINYIYSSLPAQKQVIMSSATYPEGAKSIINQYMQSSQHICPDTTSILLGITQKFTIVKSHTNIVRQTQYRFEELLKILTKFQFKQCLIFCNYQARVGEIFKMLNKEKWPAEQLYGQQDQSDRLDALKTLQQYKCRLLVSTDLAARGIDATNVDLVINFEPPYEWQTYLHRIGRAGRFGSYGTAITILSNEKEELQFRKILISMKTLIDLSNLWTNQKFFTENETTYESSNSINYTELETLKLNELNLEPDLYKTAENAFSDLKLTNKEVSNDFHQNQVIESFSDLLDSFENNEQCDDDVTNCGQFHHFYDKNSMNSFDIKKKDFCANRNNLNQFDHNQSAFLNEDKDSLNNIKSVDSNASSQTTNNESNDIIESQTEYFALFDLPISFQSKKDILNKESLSRPCNKNTIKEKYNDVKTIKLENMDKEKSKTYRLNDNDHYNYNLNRDKKRKHYNINNSNNYSDNCVSSYNTWYNQLKINMKHIEMAVFLEEMSHLYN